MFIKQHLNPFFPLTILLIFKYFFMAKFPGLDLTNIEYSSKMETRVRTNFLPIDKVVTPILELDANNQIIVKPYGKEKKSEQIIVEGHDSVAIQYILGCPISNDTNIANKGNKFAECIITDESAQKVGQATKEAGKPLPLFKAVLSGKRSIPVTMITDKNELNYIPLLKDLGITVKAGETVSQALTAAKYVYVPAQYKATPANIAKGWAPVYPSMVNTIALIEE